MAKRIFIWVAHPKPDSLSAAIADAYQNGAEANGADIRRMDLDQMTFEPDFEGDFKNMPQVEADLSEWRENLAWAEHVLIVHPYWWGGMPAKAKALIDRALTPGFAFKYHDKGVTWDKLLSGRTADVVILSDTPPMLDTLLYRKPGRRVVTNQILGFCGIKTKKVLQLGSVKTAGADKISGWMKRLNAIGARAAGRNRFALRLRSSATGTSDNKATNPV